MIFTLSPTNEGQSLNYTEKYDPTTELLDVQAKRLTLKEARTMAIDRAKQIVIGLNRLMPQGAFGCVIEEINLYISPNMEMIKQ